MISKLPNEIEGGGDLGEYERFGTIQNAKGREKLKKNRIPQKYMEKWICTYEYLAPSNLIPSVVYQR